MSITLQEVKQAYIEMYGEFFNTDEYSDFDEAFSSAWQSFDFVANATNEYDFAEAMTCLPQLTQY